MTGYSREEADALVRIWSKRLVPSDSSIEVADKGHSRSTEHCPPPYSQVNADSLQDTARQLQKQYSAGKQQHEVIDLDSPLWVDYAKIRRREAQRYSDLKLPFAESMVSPWEREAK